MEKKTVFEIVQGIQTAIQPLDIQIVGFEGAKDFYIGEAERKRPEITIRLSLPARQAESFGGVPI
jgi:hypothetical protein